MKISGSGPIAPPTEETPATKPGRTEGAAEAFAKHLDGATGPEGAAAAEVRGPGGAAQAEGEEVGHGAEGWSRQKSVAVLVGATALVAVMSEFLVGAIDEAVAKAKTLQ